MVFIIVGGLLYISNLISTFSPFSKTKKAYANHVQELEEVVGHIWDCH